MLHLAGKSSAEKTNRALDEYDILSQAGFDAVIVENYHGEIEHVESVLASLPSIGPTVGVNILPDQYEAALHLSAEYLCPFIQIDYVAGRYTKGRQINASYTACREAYPDTMVLGGVWPKYYEPIKGSSLENDIRTGMNRADAIVVTGAGTGVETPLDKILAFREIMDRVYTKFPLILGAGATPVNAKKLLPYCDGVIVGSALKPNGDTQAQIHPVLAHRCVDAFRNAWE
jgi:predicted TIM-barrel enzyme